MQTQEDWGTQNIPVTDGVLLQEALNGNQRAFEDLIHRYSTTLFNFIFHFLGDYDQACDILQQVFLQFHISLPTLRTNKPLKSWLFQVARNRCLDELRRKRAVHFSQLEAGNDEEEYPPILDIPDNSPLPEELAEQHDLQQHLHAAIRALPIKYRAIVFMRYAAQQSFAEIGQALGIPEATAKTYFQRAKPMLRSSLQEWARAIPK
jgi:RNA polymerase sigma factor (sigma-70 family)